MGLRGDLTELPLSDLIEMTSLGGKTGRLVLFDEEDMVAGELAFRGGRLVEARCGDLTAEKAFYALLTMKAGSFDFDPTAHLDPDSCNLPTETLLIEGMRRLDEVMRLRGALPAPARIRLLGGDPKDAVEARVLGYLGPGARHVGDIVEGILVDGDADEYDTLHALHRLAGRGIIRVERPPEGGGEASGAGPPQPELER